MKTAISIPDDVFEAADAAAKRLGMSRSQLYVEAVRLFLSTHGDKWITERLNEIYAKESSSLDPVLWEMTLATMRSQDDW